MTLPWRVRWMYGLGQLPEGVKTAAFGFFLLFYYNQVLGLSGTLAGAALFIALLFDAVSDPLVGSLTDFTRSRWGRRHPYLYASALPFSLCFLGLFVPPSGLSEAGLFAWLLVFATLTRTTMSFYHVPYLSMGAELSQDYDERTRLAAFRNLFQLAGMFAVLIGGNLLFFSATGQYANGQLNPAAYAPFALSCVPLMLAGVWLTALGTHDQIPKLPSPSAIERPTLIRAVVSDVLTAFRIRAFVAVVGASILFGINQGMVQALHLYLATYFFELADYQVTLLFAGASAGIVIGTLLSRAFTGLLAEKRRVFVAGSLWYAFWTSIVIILRLLGLLPGNEHPLVAPLYIVCGCISALGLGVAIPMIGSLMADVTDEHERRHGTRQEGIYYSAASLVAKAVGGVGPIIAGLIIDMAGISPGTPPAEVAPEAINRFGWFTGPGVVLFSLLSIACIGFYNITRAQHAETLANLSRRTPDGTVR
ncbi:MAG: MFS transporter [Gammaproteobacteria bacterium]|nr:MFS transporter [Gammaproteobacteria bacterium]MYK83505.1 MFS transporter [Gammaproteobacteria bacterium]